MADKDKIEELDPGKIIEEMREEYWRGLSEPDMESDEERVQVLVTDLAGEKYALDAALCRTITKYGHITRVPRMPVYMLGVINLRGRIIPVVDLAGLFNLGQSSHRDEKSRLVVVESEDARTAFLVDKVIGIEWIQLSRISEPESVTTAVKNEYIKGHVAPVAEEGWMTYLDMEKILQGSELSFGER